MAKKSKSAKKSAKPKVARVAVKKKAAVKKKSAPKKAAPSKTKKKAVKKAAVKKPVAKKSAPKNAVKKAVKKTAPKKVIAKATPRPAKKRTAPVKTAIPKAPESGRATDDLSEEVAEKAARHEQNGTPMMQPEEEPETAKPGIPATAFDMHAAEKAVTKGDPHGKLHLSQGRRPIRPSGKKPLWRK